MPSSSCHRIARALAASLLVGLASLSPAVEAAAPKAYVGNFKDDTVSVIDTATNRVVATVPVAAGPDGIVVTRDGRTAYVSGSSASSVSVIDTASDRALPAVETGRGPQGLALTPDGRSVLVAVNGEDRVAVVDVATRSIAGTIAVAKPHTIAVTPDGRRAYVASQEPGHFALAIVDLAARRVTGSIALEKPPRDLEFGLDGRALYLTLAGVAAVQVIDPGADRIVAQIPTGVSPHIANVFRGMGAGAIVVQGPGELQLFDPATNARTRAVTVGKQPHWVDATADGRVAYVSNEGSNTVSVVDIASGQTREIAVGNAPRKVAIQPAAGAAAPADPKASAADAQVVIDNFAFGPAELAVRPGATVQWQNRDGAPHGVAFKDGAPGAELLLPGTGYARRFDRPGRYDYVCSVHPYMTGRITVRAEATASADR